MLNDEYFKASEMHEDAAYERVFNKALELKARIKVIRREREIQGEFRKRPRFEGPGSRPILPKVCHLVRKVTHKYHLEL